MSESRYGPQALSLLRIVAALLFLLHGTSQAVRLSAVPDGVSRRVGSLFWIAGVIEIVGGLLLIVGLF